MGSRYWSSRRRWVPSSGWWISCAGHCRKDIPLLLTTAAWAAGGPPYTRPRATEPWTSWLGPGRRSCSGLHAGVRSASWTNRTPPTGLSQVTKGTPCTYGTWRWSAPAWKGRRYSSSRPSHLYGYTLPRSASGIAYASSPQTDRGGGLRFGSLTCADLAPRSAPPWRGHAAGAWMQGGKRASS